MRGSDDVVPEKFWNVVTQRSAVVATLSPLDELTILVLESDPRLFAVIMLNVTGEPEVLVKMFSQRANRSFVGTKTLRLTVNAPMVCGANTYWRPVHVGMEGTVASTAAAPFLL